MQVLEKSAHATAETPIFMITAYGSVEVAVDALKRAPTTISQAVGQRKTADRDRSHDRKAARLERENTELKRALKQRYSFPNIVGQERADAEDSRPGGTSAPSRATILITGETGTGRN